jgi:hypothetical protein
MQMFDPEAPPLEWDQEGEYTRSSVELYYLSHAGQQMPQVRCHITDFHASFTCGEICFESLHAITCSIAR